MKKKRKLRVVVDTGILISAFVFGGIPKKLLRHLSKEAEICVSPEILEEYRRVPLELERNGKINREQLRILIAGIAAFVSNAKLIYPKKEVSICRDQEDNMILECCLAAKADYLITGDKDLLEINPNSLKFVGLEKLKILNPRDYLSLSKY